MPKTHGRRWRGASAAPPPFAAMRGSKCVAHCLGRRHRGHVRPHACRPLPWPPTTFAQPSALAMHRPSLRPCAAPSPWPCATPVTAAMRHPCRPRVPSTPATRPARQSASVSTAAACVCRR